MMAVEMGSVDICKCCLEVGGARVAMLGLLRKEELNTVLAHS